MTASARIVVVGSANMDLVARVSRIPAAGETVLGASFRTLAGGKGANQAVAAARLGADVTFVGRVGGDPFGEELLRGMAAAHIRTDLVQRSTTAATGVALIGVDAAGGNAIMVVPGANAQLAPADVECARDRIANADALVVQLEIPLETAAYAIRTARDSGIRVILNPAPVDDPEAVLSVIKSGVDILMPNEHEAAMLLRRDGGSVTDWEACARELRDAGARCVVITLGAAGCVKADDRGTASFRAPAVMVRDTTAAGDCFTGALAVALAEGRELDAGIAFATRAAAISVTRDGAQSSLPTRLEVDTAGGATPL
jgi:ribokinase